MRAFAAKPLTQSSVRVQLAAPRKTTRVKTYDKVMITLLDPNQPAYMLPAANPLVFVFSACPKQAKKQKTDPEGANLACLSARACLSSQTSECKRRRRKPCLVMLPNGIVCATKVAQVGFLYK